MLEAAGELFAERGYAATSVAVLAERAGVSIDTVYAAVGRKPQVMRALVESALAGTPDAVPAAERDYVQRIRAAASAREKIEIYTDALADIGQRMAPVDLALRQAAQSDEDCAALRGEIQERRAANMRLFAADLRSTGEVRDDISDDHVADIVWSMNSAEYYALLVDGRRWTSQQYRDWLRDCWSRAFLR